MNTVFYPSSRFFSLIICIITIIPFLSNAQSNGNENATLYNGNAFYWSDARTDTTRETDPETGEVAWKMIMREAAFTKMNNEPIYNSTDKGTTEPAFKYGRQDEAQYFQTLFKSRTEYQGMPAFWIEKMVINKAGKPVYFEVKYDDAPNTKALKAKWGPIIEKSIKNMPYWEPGQYKGKPVLFYVDNPLHITAI